MNRLLIITITLIATFNGFTNESLNLAEKECAEVFKNLSWKGPGRHKLPKSNSTISLPQGYRICIGEDAKKAYEAVGCIDNCMEAMVLCDSFQGGIGFEYIESTSLSIEEFEKITPTFMLAAM